jgi:nitroreductase
VTAVSRAQLVGAVEDAVRAPSVHNTQPWLWRIGQGRIEQGRIEQDGIELHADWNRHLPVTDPDRRDLVISCGAALHHLLVALAARRIAAEVHRLPDPEDSGHLATVLISGIVREEQAGGTAGAVDAALYPAIAVRHTDRRRMSRRPVPEDLLTSLAEHATRHGAVLVPVTDRAERSRLLALLVDAGQAQAIEPGYAAELRMWTGRLADSRDGIPAANVAAPPVGAREPSPLRRFPRTNLRQPPQRPGHGPGDDSAELLVVATPGDADLDRLHAGEATSAVLLSATRLGLATTPLSQALEVPTSREHLGRDVLHIPEEPQLLIRVGWPATGAAELPATPRRSLTNVLLS